MLKNNVSKLFQTIQQASVVNDFFFLFDYIFISISKARGSKNVQWIAKLYDAG